MNETCQPPAPFLFFWQLKFNPCLSSDLLDRQEFHLHTYLGSSTLAGPALRRVRGAGGVLPAIFFFNELLSHVLHSLARGQNGTCA